MSRLVLQPTALAQWHALVNEACAAKTLHLPTEIESYLVFLLMRYIDQPEMVKKILAIEFLETLNQKGRQQKNDLQALGDQCLLYGGLFPGMARTKQVDLSYFISLGQSAYGTLYALNQQEEPLYQHLYQQFIALTDLLQTMRTLSTERFNIKNHLLNAKFDPFN